VDGTLIQSWASLKSFRPKEEDDEDQEDGNRWGGFGGRRRSNATHSSRTDPEARLMRKSMGAPALLCHSLHALMENRSGLLMGISVADARNRAEVEEAAKLIRRLRQRHWVRPRRLAADKGYDSGAFLLVLEEQGIQPQVAMRPSPAKATTPEAEARRRMKRRERSLAHRRWQRARPGIEKVSGWLGEIPGLEGACYVGRWKIALQAYAGAAAYNHLSLCRAGVG